MKLIRRQMPPHVSVEPPPVGRHVIIGIEAQAAKHVRGDFAAFLRRGRVQRMQCAEFRCEPLEHAQLPGDTGHSPVWSGGVRPGEDGFPHQGCPIVGIRHHQTMQKRGAAARQPSNENRPFDFLDGNFGAIHLLGMEP